MSISVNGEYENNLKNILFSFIKEIKKFNNDDNVSSTRNSHS